MVLGDSVSPADDENSSLTMLDRVRGCLLGGAVGDALGGPVEFMSIEGSMASLRRKCVRQRRAGNDVGNLLLMLLRIGREVHARKLRIRHSTCG